MMNERTNAHAFETTRLRVTHWSTLELEPAARAVSAILTAATTASLPPQWHGDYAVDRARDWIIARDRECELLFIHAGRPHAPVGVAMLVDELASDDTIRVRLGYVLASASWGQGYATEFVEGLVTQVRRRAAVTSIAGGVEQDNPASARVLEKCGFVIESTDGVVDLYVRSCEQQ